MANNQLGVLDVLVVVVGGLLVGLLMRIKSGRGVILLLVDVVGVL